MTSVEPAWEPATAPPTWRVLVVGDFLPPVGGGMEAHVEGLALALAERGHQVEVHVAGPAERARALPFNVTVAGTLMGRVPGIFHDADRPFPPPWPDPIHGRSLAATIARFQPDVIHAHGWSAFTAAAAARRAAVPLVVTLHDYGLLCPLRTLLRGEDVCASAAGLACIRCPDDTQGPVRRATLAGAMRLFPPRVAAFVAVSDAVRDRHVAHGTVPTPVTVENFVDLEDRRPTAVPVAGSVLFVGSDAPVKGLDVLHRAVKQRPWKWKNEVVVVGTRPQSGSGFPFRYRGRLEGPSLCAEFRAAAVVVVPSLWEEPGPIVALEALTFGRPVVGSRVGGMRTSIEPGRSGILVPPGDAEALRSALDRLLADSMSLVQMGEVARMSATRYTKASIVPRIEAVYAGVIGSSTAVA